MPLFLVAAFFLSCAHTPGVPQENQSRSSETSSAENLSPVPAALKNVPVLLIGETHYFTPFGAYEYILNKVVTEEGVCVGVEFPFEAGEFSVSLNKLRARAGVVKNPEDKARINRVAETYEKLMQLARARKLRLFGVDDKNHYASELNVEQRNKSMAENIAHLLKAKSCNRVVAIVGKAHLTMGSSRNSTVKLLLGAAGVASVSINLQMTNESGVPEEYQSFESSGLQSPMEFEWIDNKVLPNMTRVLPNIKNDLSVWQEFDWTLLIPIIFKAEKL